MFLTVKYSLILAGLITAGLVLALGPAVLAADPADTGADKALGGLENTAKTGYGKLPSQTDLPIIIGKVVGAALAFVGVIFFLLILWAGFGWMLAKGNEQKITEAKETIITAVLGLIVILGAYAITALIAMIFSNALKGA